MGEGAGGRFNYVKGSAPLGDLLDAGKESNR